MRSSCEMSWLLPSSSSVTDSTWANPSLSFLIVTIPSGSPKSWEENTSWFKSSFHFLSNILNLTCFEKLRSNYCHLKYPENAFIFNYLRQQWPLKYLAQINSKIYEVFFYYSLIQYIPTTVPSLQLLPSPHLFPLSPRSTTPPFPRQKRVVQYQPNTAQQVTIRLGTNPPGLFFLRGNEKLLSTWKILKGFLLSRIILWHSLPDLKAGVFFVVDASLKSSSLISIGVWMGFETGHLINIAYVTQCWCSSSKIKYIRDYRQLRMLLVKL